MATNTSNVGSTQTLASSLDPSLTTLASTAKTTGKKDIGKEEFLTMLVAQLKNQDPMDPMNNQDFAVNLAQFSQLEQLMSINKKVQTGGMGSSGDSLASYLGHEVLLNSSKIQVNAGDGGKISFKLDADAAQVKVDLLDANGAVKETVNLGSMKAGQQSAALSKLTTQSGSYNIKINAISSSGMAFNPAAFVVGMVSGFVPGADPKLIVDGNEVSPGDVKEVRLPAGEAGTN